MKINNKAFTLVELLVVVLIIGILAAIAVPQYRLAVEKARIAQVIPAIKSIGQAEEAYYLANNKYTDNIKELDINIVVPKGWSMTLWAKDGYNKVEFQRKTNGNHYIALIHYYPNSTEGVHMGQIYCYAQAGDPFGIKLCKNTGNKIGYIDSDGNIRIII